MNTTVLEHSGTEWQPPSAAASVRDFRDKSWHMLPEHAPIVAHLVHKRCLVSHSKLDHEFDRIRSNYRQAGRSNACESCSCSGESGASDSTRTTEAASSVRKSHRSTREQGFELGVVHRQLAPTSKDRAVVASTRSRTPHSEATGMSSQLGIHEKSKSERLQDVVCLQEVLASPRISTGPSQQKSTCPGGPNALGLEEHPHYQRHHHHHRRPHRTNQHAQPEDELLKATHEFRRRALFTAAGIHPSVSARLGSSFGSATSSLSTALPRLRCCLLPTAEGGGGTES